MMDGMQQARAVKRHLTKMVATSPDCIFVRGPKKAEHYHGAGEYAAVICAEEVDEDLTGRLSHLRTGLVGLPGVIGFHGDDGRPRNEWDPPYPQRRGAYYGLGTDRFTIIIVDGEVDHEEEIDVDALDVKEAREMALTIIERDYEPGTGIADIIGPRYGMYL